MKKWHDGKWLDIQIRRRHHCNESFNGLVNLTASKTFFASNTKDNVETLRGRLNQWKDGQIEKLLVEDKTIQERLVKDNGKNQNSDRKAALICLVSKSKQSFKTFRKFK